MLRLSPCAQPCVFGKQSPGPLRCGRLSPAPLLPRLRGDFAEFLDRGSPARLGMLYQPTCVGIRYGRAGAARAAFLGPGGARVRLMPSPLARTGTSRTRTVPPPGRPRAAECAPARLGSVDPTPVGYGLRPRLRPRLTLGGRAFPRKPRASGGVDSHHALATRASILAPARSTQPRRLRFPARGTLPYRWGPQAPSRRFGASLSPVNCRRAPTRPVSCYALFGRVAASGPTSWLSWKAHILCHSAMTWGPWRAVWAVPLSGAELSSRVLTPGILARRRSEFGSLRQAARPPRGSGALPPPGTSRG